MESLGIKGLTSRLFFWKLQGQRLLRNESIIKTIMLLYLFVILYFFWYIQRTSSLPIIEDFPGQVGIEERDNLFKLIDSYENRELFSSIDDSRYSFFDSQENVLGTAELRAYHLYQRQPYVTNGLIGSRIPSLGQGFAYDLKEPLANDDSILNGWPLFNRRYSGAFVAGFYDLQAKVNSTNFPELYADGYESILASIPQWTTLTINLTKEDQTYALDPSVTDINLEAFKYYSQNLSLSTGTVSTKYVWLDSLEITYRVTAHKKYLNLGIVELKMRNLDSRVLYPTLTDILDFHTSERCQLQEAGFDNDGIFLQFQPQNIPYVNGSVYSTLDFPNELVMSSSKNNSESTAFQSLRLKLAPMSEVTILKYVGIVTSDSEYTHSRSDALIKAKKVAMHRKNILDIIGSHRSAFESQFSQQTKIDFFDDSFLSLISNASLYHLFVNTRPNAAGITSALPVSGLSSDSYGGMVFWDSDLWIFNALLLFFPENARSIINYRSYMHKQAKENDRTRTGAVYPWTSGRFGNCTSTGPCFDYEYHINIAIAMSAWNYYLSGAGDELYLKEIAFPLINDTASFLANYVTLNSSLGLYETHNLTDPDEYANHISNAAYTNAGISWLMRVVLDVFSHLKLSPPEKYNSIVGKMYIPYSNNSDEIVLEYTSMNSSVEIKQADVVMMTYPLNNELISEKTALLNLHYYSSAQSSDGPAMTFPIFSIASAKLSTVGCSSLSYLYKAVQPFIRGPFAQFSEQNNDNVEINGGTHPAFPFLTGHGGLLQAIVHGLFGMRYSYELNADGKLIRILSFDPISIPCFEKGVKIQNIKYLNQSITIGINATTFEIKNNGPHQGAKPAPIQIKMELRNPASGMYLLKQDEMLSFPLFKPMPLELDSISECGLSKVWSITEGVHGDVPALINDGDLTTHWQSANNSGKVLFDLKRIRKVKKLDINWGDKPAEFITVSIIPKKVSEQISSNFILGAVDFGNGVNEKFKFANRGVAHLELKEVFQVVKEKEVNITAAYDPIDAAEIKLRTRFNQTSIHLDHEIETRFVLFEFEGTHDADLETTYGAKIYEIQVF